MLNLLRGNGFCSPAVCMKSLNREHIQRIKLTKILTPSFLFVFMSGLDWGVSPIPLEFFFLQKKGELLSKLLSQKIKWKFLLHVHKRMAQKCYCPLGTTGWERGLVNHQLYRNLYNKI